MEIGAAGVARVVKGAACGEALPVNFLEVVCGEALPVSFLGAACEEALPVSFLGAALGVEWAADRVADR